MIPTTLSIVERQILVNQYLILSYLDEENKEFHQSKVEILEAGYTQDYKDVFFVSEEVSIEICDETTDILKMYKRIAQVRLSPEDKDKIGFAKIEFKGFDQQASDPHYRYAKFKIEKEGKGSEHKDKELNSHGASSMATYRTMLNYTKEKYDSGKGQELDKDDIEKMISLV